MGEILQNHGRAGYQGRDEGGKFKDKPSRQVDLHSGQGIEKNVLDQDRDINVLDGRAVAPMQAPVTEPK